VKGKDQSGNPALDGPKWKSWYGDMKGIGDQWRTVIIWLGIRIVGSEWGPVADSFEPLIRPGVAHQLRREFLHWLSEFCFLELV
jgi:hypothetical protein